MTLCHGYAWNAVCVCVRLCCVRAVYCIFVYMSCIFSIITLCSFQMNKSSKYECNDMNNVNVCMKCVDRWAWLNPVGHVKQENFKLHFHPDSDSEHQPPAIRCGKFIKVNWSAFTLYHTRYSSYIMCTTYITYSLHHTHTHTLTMDHSFYSSLIYLSLWYSS